MSGDGGVEIRLARPSDLLALLALEQESFDEPWVMASLQEAVAGERYRVLIAHCEGTPCGYVIASTVGDEGEIARIAVGMAWRRRGLGRRLLKAALDECRQRGVLRFFLEVRAGNEVALRLYERAGFRRTGLRRRYYRDGEDAVIMEIVLNRNSIES
ncbi:MAG TPA: ribosomal protein S18-alanine N-acetyltransferase [Abditibacteriaceae bacterium]|nr:ribosomal protein S18-alanine N-acetyltransferase [Abditibacteriaceae bacterium]